MKTPISKQPNLQTKQVNSQVEHCRVATLHLRSMYPAEIMAETGEIMEERKTLENDRGKKQFEIPTQKALILKLKTGSIRFTLTITKIQQKI